ncbi:MAG: nucleotide pyrophosphohydrolase [Rhodocyclaceae bacterium]|nr:nucleotide pyrophosphohydrolase [Rhodocyclaceae bacterium]
MASDSLSDLTRAVLEFRDARDWAQFHSLRKLMVSLNLEAAELLEHTQWLDDAEVDALPSIPEARRAMEEECADVLTYLLLIADRAHIDLAQAVREKLVRNAERYPVELAKGSREKYTRLRRQRRANGQEES